MKMNKSKLFEEELARRNPDWEKIVVAHNDALATEREIGHNTAVALGQQIIKLEDQLAAEREAGVKALAERSFELHECQKQLDAEQEKVKKLQLLVQDLGEVLKLTDKERKLAGLKKKKYQI